MVSFPGNGRTVGGGRAALPKLNWGVERREGDEKDSGKHGKFYRKGSNRLITKAEDPDTGK